MDWALSELVRATTARRVSGRVIQVIHQTAPNVVGIRGLRSRRSDYRWCRSGHARVSVKRPGGRAGRNAWGPHARLAAGAILAGGDRRKPAFRRSSPGWRRAL